MTSMYKSTILNSIYEPLSFNLRDSIVCALPASSVGKKIKKLRYELDLTQHEFGILIGNKNSTIANWENGIKNPTHKTLINIIYIFNLPIDYFNF